MQTIHLNKCWKYVKKKIGHMLENEGKSWITGPTPSNMCLKITNILNHKIYKLFYLLFRTIVVETTFVS
jgi:hypothetical protein